MNSRIYSVAGIYSIAGITFMVDINKQNIISLVLIILNCWFYKFLTISVPVTQGISMGGRWEIPPPPSIKELSFSPMEAIISLVLLFLNSWFYKYLTISVPVSQGISMGGRWEIPPPPPPHPQILGLLHALCIFLY